MSYEIQQHTICDGWVNTWRIEHLDGSVEYETFETYDEACAALEEYLFEIWEEICAGQSRPDAHNPEMYRIAEAGVS